MRGHAGERNQVRPWSIGRGLLAHRSSFGNAGAERGRRLLRLICSLALALSFAVPAGVILALVPARSAGANTFGERRPSRRVCASVTEDLTLVDTARAIIDSNLYMTLATADAAGQALADLDRCLEVFSRSSEYRGGSRWSREEVEPGARLRLYRATASALWVLDSHDRRIPIALGPAPV
jgi:hypothetical protein